MSQDAAPSIPDPPSADAVRAAAAALAPMRWWTSPRFSGLEHVPRAGRVLLVGNHTVFGLVDVPLMVLGIHEATGRWARGLGDHAHFRIPGWRDLLQTFGTVPGTRAHCAALMAADQPVLVFPGGGREVMKRKDEAYRLLWKERVGFARLAIEHRCPVVPFAAVGAEDAYDILVDGDHPLRAVGRALARRVDGREDMVFPIARGLGPTPVPKPERFYFAFGPPIATTALARRKDRPAAAALLRDEVRGEVERLIAQQRAVQAADPGRRLSGRVLGRG